MKTVKSMDDTMLKVANMIAFAVKNAHGEAELRLFLAVIINELRTNFSKNANRTLL